MMTSSYQALKNNPSLGWVLASGLLIAAPILVSVVLISLTVIVYSQQQSILAPTIFTGVFVLVSLVAFSFWHALIINSLKLAKSADRFGFVACFKGVRPVFSRSILLLVLSGIYLVLMSVLLTIITSTLLTVLIMGVFVASIYMFLQTSAYLKEYTLKESLTRSVIHCRSVSHLMKFVSVFVIACLSLVVIGFGRSDILMLSFGSIVDIAVAFASLSMYSVFNPVFGFLIVFAGLGYVHVFLLFIWSLIAHFLYLLVIDN